MPLSLNTSVCIIIDWKLLMQFCMLWIAGPFTRESKSLPKRVSAYATLADVLTPDLAPQYWW